MKKNIIFLSCIWCCIFTTSFVSLKAQVKKLYLAIDDHTDYMWTADEAKYDSAFVQMLDYYLFQIDSTKNLPADFQARFNTDGSLWLKAYAKYRSPQQFNKLIAALKSGHLSSPLNMLVSCYGGQPTEAVLRGMYYAGQLERKYKLRFTLAGSMENNTLPLGVSALWAGSGAKYSWKGIGGYGSQMSYSMRTKRKYQMYRSNGLDGSGVIMKWYAYDESKTAPLGGYAECRLHMKYKNVEDDLFKVINTLDTFCNTTSTYPYKIAGAFGFGHDDLETFVAPAFINAAQLASTSTRKVRVSNIEDFFKDFEKNYPSIPSQSVSFGNEWDLLPASMNETTAKVRRATEKLRIAEAMAAIVSLKEPSFMNRFAKAKDEAWESLGVYWEHNWTADGPVSRKTRANWQIKRQELLTNYVDTLFNASAKKLSQQITKNVENSFYVFNALSWERADVVDVVYSGALPIKVIDQATQKEVPSQVIEKLGKKYIRILAEKIPSVGYKLFQIKQGTPEPLPIAAKISGAYFSNAYYRLLLSKSGAIKELYDSLANGRQLVKLTNGKYANDLGGNGEGEELQIENAGPVSVTLKAVSKNPVLHTVRVTLFASIPRIEIEDSIQQNFSDVTTWAFSFDLNSQTTSHEELGAILKVKKEYKGGHYADDNARYDWQTFNHFVNLSESNYGVTLSNMDCSFFKLGNSSVDSLCESSSQINALAGGNIDKKLEDKGILGILNQNGQKDFQYQFAITTNQTPFNATNAIKFSLAHQNPLLASPVTGAIKPNSATSFSLLNSSHPAVILWSIKPAEETGNGLIARFWNTQNSSVNPTLSFNKPVLSAWKTSHIETNEKMLKTLKGKLGLNFGAHQIKTYRVYLLMNASGK